MTPTPRPHLAGLLRRAAVCLPLILPAAAPAATLDETPSIDGLLGTAPLMGTEGAGQGVVSLPRSLGLLGAEEETLRQRAEADPRNIALLKQLALVQVRNGHPEAAIETLEKVHALAPQDAMIALDIARLVGATQGAPAARAALERFRTAAADPFPFELALVQLDHDAGATSAARARIAQMLTTAPEAQKGRLRLLLARYLLAAGDTAGAAAQVESVLVSEPANVDALAFRALFRLNALDLDGARADIAAGLGADPDNVALLRLSARGEWRAGQRDLAIERLLRAAELSLWHEDVVLDAAKALDDAGRSQQAGTLIETALGHQPDAPQLLARLGQIRLTAGDWTGAEAAAAQLRLTGSAEAISDSEKIRVAVLRGRGQTEEAFGLMRSLADQGADLGAIAEVVNHHLAKGDPAEALAYVDTRLSATPGQPALLLMRASLSDLLGKPDAAEADYRRVVRTLPQSAVAHVALARHLMHRDRPADAEAALRAGLAERPDDPSLKMPLVEILLRRADIDGALALMEDMVRAYPDNALVANNYVSLVTDHAPLDPVRIARAAEVAGQLGTSAVPQLRDTYGWLLHIRGQHAQARQILEPVLAEIPQDAWANYHMGMVCKALGDREGAARHLQAALRSTDSSFTKAEQVLSALQALTEN